MRSDHPVACQQVGGAFCNMGIYLAYARIRAPRPHRRCRFHRTTGQTYNRRRCIPDAPPVPHVPPQVDAGVDASAGLIPLANDQVVNYLSKRHVPKPPGMYCNPGKCSVITRLHLHSISFDHGQLPTKKDNPDIRWIDYRVIQYQVPRSIKRDSIRPVPLPFLVIDLAAPGLMHMVSGIFNDIIDQHRSRAAHSECCSTLNV